MDLSEESNSSKPRNINYKPRQGSQAANILKILKLGGANLKSMTKKDIEDVLCSKGHEKPKQWKNSKEQLLKNSSIAIDPNFDYESFFLTEKGSNFVGELEEKETSNASRQKIK